MPTPTQITYRGMPRSEALEATIRGHIEDLETVFDRIVSCHVSIGAPHQHQRQGHLFEVHVDISVPGAYLVVDRSPVEDESHADVHVAVRDAFRAAKRQLEKYVHRRHGALRTN
jgi:ribosome-associated translation inhibitor RaiA